MQLQVVGLEEKIERLSSELTGEFLGGSQAQQRVALQGLDGQVSALRDRLEEGLGGTRALAQQVADSISERLARLEAGLTAVRAERFGSVDDDVLEQRVQRLREAIAQRITREDFDRALCKQAFDSQEALLRLQQDIETKLKCLQMARYDPELLNAKHEQLQSQLVEVAKELQATRSRSVGRANHAVLAEAAGVTNCMCCYQPRSPTPERTTTTGFDGRLYTKITAGSPSSALDMSVGASAANNSGGAAVGAVSARDVSMASRERGPCATHGLPPAPLAANGNGPSIPSMARGHGQAEAGLGPFELHLQRGRDRKAEMQVKRTASGAGPHSRSGSRPPTAATRRRPATANPAGRQSSSGGPATFRETVLLRQEALKEQAEALLKEPSD